MLTDSLTTSISRNFLLFLNAPSLLWMKATQKHLNLNSKDKRDDPSFHNICYQHRKNYFPKIAYEIYITSLKRLIFNMHPLIFDLFTIEKIRFVACDLLGICFNWLDVHDSIKQSNKQEEENTSNRTIAIEEKATIMYSNYYNDTSYVINVEKSDGFRNENIFSSNQSSDQPLTTEQNDDDDWGYFVDFIK